MPAMSTHTLPADVAASLEQGLAAMSLPAETKGAMASESSRWRVTISRGSRMAVRL